MEHKEIMEMMYWLFSTVPQTLGALLGIFAMTAIYRNQQLQYNIDRHENSMRLHYHSLFPHRNNMLSYYEILDKIEEKDESFFQNNNHRVEHKKYIDIYGKSIQMGEKGKKAGDIALKDFGIKCVGMIMFSLLLLYFLPSIKLIVSFSLYIWLSLYFIPLGIVLYSAYKLFKSMVAEGTLTLTK